ncbi:GL20705 [Drosophila persimilis]|uniref:GL20705 n=1 Tax=Drosophila persimilis TaxID=7234 RepID=B4H4B6_DROPE|nr:GL20705 [Drosophila persimilis]
MPCPPSSVPRIENNCSTFPVPKDADGPLELLRAVKPTTAALMLNGLQNHLLGSNYKSMLADWVSNEQYPNPTDILMINSKLSELAQSKQMGRIYDIMKHLCRYALTPSVGCFRPYNLSFFIYRLIKKKRDNVCEWHMAYKVIEESVQHQLMAIESYMLKLPDTISCVICHKPMHEGP